MIATHLLRSPRINSIKPKTSIRERQFIVNLFFSHYEIKFLLKTFLFVYSKKNALFVWPNFIFGNHTIVTWLLLTLIGEETMSKRGDKNNITEAYYSGLMSASGFRRQDIDKPVIAIVNSWTDANPGHKPLAELAKYVREGIWAAGGTPVEFSVPAPCDGMAQGEGMHYILPQRDLIAASVESMVKAHGFDGLVFLGSCDKIIPGMLMAAGHLNKPTLFLTAGAMQPYREEGREFVTSDLKEAIGKKRIGEIDDNTMNKWISCMCGSAGTCSILWLYCSDF